MEAFTVNLEGGSPWGFSIQGGLDHRSPLRVGKVTPGGRASKAGLIAGDYILSINGEDSKNLKHLQAQQLIKKSVNTVALVCTKVRPGVTSPAPHSLTQSFTFTNKGTTTPPRQPLVKAPPIAKPKAPQVSSGSGGTSGESRATGSSSAHGNVDVYDVKFQGMDVVDHGGSKPQDNGNTPHSSNECQQGLDFTCIDQSHPMENGNGPAQGSCHGDGNKVNHQSSFGKEEGVANGSPTAIQFKRLTKDALASAITQAAANRVRRESSGEREGLTNGVSTSGAAVDVEPALQVHVNDEPLTYNLSSASGQVEEHVSEVRYAEQPMTYQDLDNDELQVEESKINEAQPPEANIPAGGEVQEPVYQVEQVEQPLVYQFDENRTVPVVEEPVSYVNQAREESLTYTFDTQSKENSQAPPTGTQATPSVTAAKPPINPQHSASIKKEEEPVAIVKKDPGWYKQMFQQLQNNVEEDSQGGSVSSTSKPSDDNPTYVYDHRGLKVRKDSLTKQTEDDEAEEERDKSRQTPDEEPVYVYDHRGLRVRASSLSKAQESTSDNDNLSESQQKKDVRPKSASAATNKLSVSSGVTKDDIVNQSKQSTSYRTEQYNTDASRDYWRERDKDHQEWDQKRRQSQEYTLPQHQRTASGSNYADNMSHMHPLLRDDTDESSNQPAATTDDQPKLFDRIDASKLQGALSTATMMGQLQQEGVPSHLLPAVVQAQREAEASEAAAASVKKEKPPPGPKAKALFDFDAQSAKELSFKKGDFLDLLHTVDDNWLEASLAGSKGIVPKNYLKVLTLPQYREMIAPAPPKPTQLAKALFDFTGQRDRELTFKKGDELHIERKIDANWYEGFHEDVKGIFPVPYVQVIESS